MSLCFRLMRSAKLKLKWSSLWVRVCVNKLHATGVHATCICCSQLLNNCRRQRVDAKLILKCPRAFDVTQSQKKTTEVMTPPDTLSHSTCFLQRPAPPHHSSAVFTCAKFQLNKCQNFCMQSKVSDALSQNFYMLIKNIPQK